MLAAQAFADDVGDRPGEEAGEEGDGRGEQRRGGEARRPGARMSSDQRSTRSVHWSIHSSRLAPISSGGSSNTSVGRGGVLHEHLRQRGALAGGEHEHVERHVGLDVSDSRKSMRRPASSGWSVPVEDAGVLDLPEAAGLDHPGGGVVDRRVGERRPRPAGSTRTRRRGAGRPRCPRRRRTGRSRPRPSRRRPRRRWRAGRVHHSSQPSSPKARTVASRNARPGDDVAGSSTTRRSRVGGVGQVVEARRHGGSSAPRRTPGRS